MLWKYRNLDNPHVQMILRFFYDGFKNKHYFWEIVNTLRKFLIAIAIIIARIRGAVYQLYGFVWIIQAGNTKFKFTITIQFKQILHSNFKNISY